jgi:uncharacterized membrane protein YdbT with pleckstrin-like domain
LDAAGPAAVGAVAVGRGRASCRRAGEAENELMSDAKESTIWKGTPSQYVNIGWFALAIFLALLAVPIWLGLSRLAELPMSWQAGIVLVYLIVPAAIAIYRWLEVRYEIYELTEERLKLSQGVLTRTTDELELYRIRDTTVVEPFLLRLVGCGHVKMETSDRTHPEMTIHAIRSPSKVREQIRERVEEMRARKHVREVDFAGGAEGGDFEGG